MRHLTPRRPWFPSRARALRCLSSRVGAVPAYSVQDELKEGKLVQLFAHYPLEATNVFVVYPSRQFVDAKIKTFVDHLIVSLKQKLDLRAEHATADIA